MIFFLLFSYKMKNIIKHIYTQKSNNIPIRYEDNWKIIINALTYLFLGDNKNLKINDEDKESLNSFFWQNWQIPWEMKIENFFYNELMKAEENHNKDNDPILEAHELGKKLFNEEILLKQYFNSLFWKHTQILSQDSVNLIEKKIKSIFKILLEFKDKIAQSLYNIEFVSSYTEWKDFKNVSKDLLLHMDESLLDYPVSGIQKEKNNTNKKPTNCNIEDVEKFMEETDALLKEIENENNIVLLKFNLQKIFTHLHKYYFILKYTKNTWIVHDYLLSWKNNKQNNVSYFQKYSLKSTLKDVNNIEDIDFLTWKKTSYVEKTQFFIKNIGNFINRFSKTCVWNKAVKLNYKNQAAKLFFYENWKFNPNKKIYVDLLNNKWEKKTSFDELYDFEIITIVEQWENFLLEKYCWDDVELFNKLKNEEKKRKPISEILENYSKQQSEIHDEIWKTNKKKDYISTNYNKIKKLSYIDKLNQKSNVLSKYRIKWIDIRSFDLFSKFDTEYSYPNLVLQSKNENNKDSLFAKLSSLIENGDAFFAYLENEWVEIDYNNQDEKDEIVKVFLWYMNEIKNLENKVHKKLDRKDSEWEFNGLVKAVWLLTWASIRTGWVTDMSGNWLKQKKDWDPVTAEHLTQSKSFTRAIDKLINQYDWDMWLFNDAKRATLEYETLPESIWAMKKLIDLCAIMPNVEELIMVDKFGKTFEGAPKASGYRDFKFIVKFKADKEWNQETAELMFHVSPMLKTKMYGHEIEKKTLETIWIWKDVKNPDSESMDIISQTIYGIKKLRNKVDKPTEWHHEKLPSDWILFEIRRYLIDSLDESLRPIWNKEIYSFEIEELINTKENTNWKFSDEIWKLKKNPEKLELYRKYLIVIEKLSIIGSVMFGSAHKEIMKWMWEYYDSIKSY